MIKKTYWDFFAYKSGKDYKEDKAFFSKRFYDHGEMKSFSSKHSRDNKTKHPNYCSDYDRADPAERIHVKHYPYGVGTLTLWKEELDGSVFAEFIPPHGEHWEPSRLVADELGRFYPTNPSDYESDDPAIYPTREIMRGMLLKRYSDEETFDIWTDYKQTFCKSEREFDNDEI